MTVKQITSDFADRVGGDGFHDIKRAKNWCVKVFWIVVFLIAWTLVCYQVVTYIKKYLTYPVTTKVELKFDSAALFPAITICNLNPVKNKEVAVFGEEMRDMLKQEPPPQPKNKKGTWDETIEKNPTPPTYPDYDGHSFMIDGEGEEPGERWALEDHPQEILQQDSFYHNYFSIPPQDKQRIGHHIRDMLVECIWKQKQCYPDNFTHFLHPQYGNCYTFNAGWTADEGTGTKTSKSPEKVTMPGPTDGLSVILYVEGSEYLPLLADSTGVRVQVHDQGTLPHPEQTGFTVSSGFSTALEIRKVAITRLPLPYNSADCVDGEWKYGASVQKVWPIAAYSLSTCMKLCYQEKLQDTCACVHPQLFFFGDTTTTRACNSSKPIDGFCMKKYDTQFRRGAYSAYCGKECVQACQETDFDVQVSSAQWPNDFYMEILRQNVAQRNEDLGKMMQSKQQDDDVRKNVLKLDVYYQSLNFKMIQEEPGYILVEMFADLGGAVDLWVGMSVLAMVQCLEYFAQLFFYLCWKKPHMESDDKVQRVDVYGAKGKSSFEAAPRRY